MSSVARLGLVCAALLACGDGEQRRPTAQAKPSLKSEAAPDLRLVLMTDLNGYLEPCGCQSRPLGGIGKAATRLHELESDAVPTFFLHAGDLLFEASTDGAHGGDPRAADAPAGERGPQDLWQAETLAGILGELGMDASTWGPGDRARGQGHRAALQKIGGFRFLDPDVPEPVMLTEAKANLGVVALSVDAPDAVAAARRAVAQLRKGGAAAVVALAVGSPRSARRLAGTVAGLDFLVHGGVDQSERRPPERIGGATLLRAARHGEGLLSVDIFRRGEGAFGDDSVWTRDAELGALSQRIEDLAARIARWKKQGQQDSADVRRQEERLAAMRAEQAALAERPAREGNVFRARFFELAPEVPRDRAIATRLREHDKRVNDHNKVAFADRAPSPVPAGTPAYLGSVRCGECHEPALAWWRGHAHGQAYATLEERNKQYNLSCVGCHVTGYGRPGGAEVVQNEGLTDVGCESCHGPGSLHADDPDIDTDKNVTLDPPEATCLQCHNEEHSDRFDYAAYRATLIVPGHGLPAPEAQ